MKPIDLNADIGEGFESDTSLLPVVTSANVCCGEHAGSRDLTLRTIQLCIEYGVRYGAHPGVPDRESMGRNVPDLAGADAWRSLAESIRRQVESVANEGASYVKLHGALYNASATEEQFAALVCEALRGFGLPFMGLPGSRHEAISTELGVQFVSEGFADRAYAADGTLMSRSLPGSVLTDLAQITEQALALADRVDSICFHGDNPGCDVLAASVRAALETAGHEVRTWH